MGGRASRLFALRLTPKHHYNTQLMCSYVRAGLSLGGMTVGESLSWRELEVLIKEACDINSASDGSRFNI